MNNNVVRIGSGTFDHVQIRESQEKGKCYVHVLSGIDASHVYWVVGALATISVFLFWYEYLAFSLIFGALAIGTLLLTLTIFRGRFLYFERQHLVLGERDLEWPSGAVWNLSEISGFSQSIQQISNFDGGTAPGWVIKIENKESEWNEFHFALKKDYEAFWQTLNEWQTKQI